VSLVDVGIVAFVIALAAVGYERGLVASALPLTGFVVGAALGARVAPALLSDGAESPYAPLVSVLAGVLLGAIAAVALDSFGQVLRRRIVAAPARALDGVGGALLLAALALLLAWGFGAVALHTSGDRARDLRRAVQRSTILAALNDALPPSGPLLNVLRRVDPRPVVRGPDADVAAPDSAAPEDPDVVAAGRSTVRVLGTACGLGVTGSGWVAGDRLVVTNAHVVAGQDDTTVSVVGGPELEAVAVQELTAPPLDLVGRPRKGTEAAVIGFPENGPLAFTPARLGRSGTVISRDAYGRGPVQREMTPFRADVRSGNSGGPVVDLGGDVVTTVFAASTGSQPQNGLGIPNPIVAGALAGELAETDTGPCAA
jgi:uncharacterized membrane protein required for colicin V production